jgi:heme/copper-type cytochrome/quinol oxidase subunit 1
MITTFKIITIGLLALLAVNGQVMLSDSTIDIHLHDTYFVIDINQLLFLFGF